MKKDLKRVFPKKIKSSYIIVLVLLILLVSIAIPSLARYKNRTSIKDAVVWDGKVATSYRAGTGSASDPYIISNGSELAYFANQLETTNYTNTYFKLNHDIVLNDGIFKYDTNSGITYTKQENISNITPYQESYNDINKFSTLNNFKGHLDGNYYTIYGLFITDSNAEELGLFTNLEGSVENLYVSNSIIYGGNITGGIASTATNASLENVIYSGYVIGNDTGISKTIDIPINDISTEITNEETNQVINIQNIPRINGEIESIKLTGNYQSSDEIGTLKINNQLIIKGNFEVDLGTTITHNFITQYSSTQNTTYQLTNLKYQIVYRYGNSAGIISEANNITLKNVVNKADVYGSVYGSGFVNNLIGQSTIEQSYNTGTINGNISAAGIITNIKENTANISIEKSYNSGTINSPNNSALLTNVQNNSGIITINNTFNTSDIYLLGNINDSIVNILNVITTSNFQIKTGTVNGSIVTINDNIKNYAKTNLGFGEFIDDDNLATNSNSVWVFNNTTLPILYIDDINDPIANINLSKYSWNNIGYQLNTLKFNSKFAFSIDEVDSLKPIKEKYYYISNSQEPLSNSQVTSITSWQPYSNIVEINEEGFYVIYAKVIDYDNNVSYLNTDLLVLDLSGSEVNIKLNNNSWKSLSDNIENIYLGTASSINIDANDDLSGVNNIRYYLSSEKLNKEELDALDVNNWQLYQEPILISSNTGLIVYARVEDNCNYVTYANTDKIIIDGYKLNKMIAGRNTSDTNSLITDKSTISLNYSFSDNSNYQDGYKHSLMSNILLPQNTIITLVDQIRNKVYKYQIETSEDDFGYNDSCKDSTCTKIANYPFSLFEEIGKGSMESNLKEESYTGNINENYLISLDFSKTNLTSDLTNVKVYINLKDDKDNVIRPLLESTLKSFKVITNSSAITSLTSTYSNTIFYNSDSVYNIPFTASLINKTYNNNPVSDTSYENKNLGLAIKLVDVNDQTVSKEYLKNLIFKFNNKKYSPDNDGVVRINLENTSNIVNSSLEIETYADNSKLSNGNYYFKVGIFTAYDGYYSKDIDYTLAIPVQVINQNILKNTNFAVNIDDNNRVITKLANAKLNFNIFQNSGLTNPIVRVSLYKKTNLTAFDQEYTSIDLAQYINESLALYKDNIYNTYITTNSSTINSFVLNLDTTKMESNGYLFLFELYDGDKKIDKIEKTIIIK